MNKKEKIIVILLIFFGIVLMIYVGENDRKRTANFAVKNMLHDNTTYSNSASTYKSNYWMGDSNSNIFSISSNDKKKNAFECAKDALIHRNLMGCSKIIFCDYENATIEYSTSSWDSSYSYKVSGTVTYYDSSNTYKSGYFNVELQLTSTGYENAYPYLF